MTHAALSDLIRENPQSGAVFSEDRARRYLLWRQVNEIFGVGTMTVCMLNPSIATETEEDPTVRRCMGFARRDGARWLVVTNACAKVSTDPAQIAEDPTVDRTNDAVLRWAFGMSKESAYAPLVLGWGVNLKKYLPARERHILELLRETEAKPMCWGITTGGSPRHPLYLPGEAKLVPYGIE